ncbi:hypothetical protein CIK52_03525 [Kocuria rosea]|uniref:hypothetical protein n=1 Tax=Kocuria rosea TaxID=1275 RepID=UPI000D645407|nr:hypothetical protein [Kocuria rosea]MEB2526988.1 hypothetical protein [Kocuria rosea]MEB2616787.1 hypothetical protein [Kocuria rosea]PWF88349.1 hypothetical protein CIK52_03525 [Kocuria rosea]QCY32300.1 hypothetical protein EQG70_04935 [Kocuria rosea]TQN30103.1 hypothetical protein FHX38_3318 [Kocuria rosea]
MSSLPPARRARLLAVAALTGTTAVTGALVGATPAVAVPVAIEENLVGVLEGNPATGAESFFVPVQLTDGNTAYGIHEDQPLAPVGELVLDDEGYAVAEPFDDPAAGWENVVGEKVDDNPVYWEPENAALAGYILSVFGPTEDSDEALAVHWAVRSLSTAELPQPDGLEPWHLDRAAFLIEDARENVPALTPQDGYRVSVSFAPDGRPETLLVTVPESYYFTTVTLSGPVTFADGTTTRTVAGGEREQRLELAVPAGVTDGELTAELTATMPSTELTVLADDQYRDLLIAGQERTVDWTASAGFEIDAPTAPEEEVTDEETTPPDDDGTGDAPVDQDTPTGNDTDDDRDVDGISGPGSDTDSGDGATGPDAEPAVRDGGAPVLEVVTDAAAEQKLTATLEAFVLFDEQTTTSTEVVTETTMTAGGAAYAESAMANTGMGAAPAAGERSAMTSVILVVVAVGAGLGAWLLRRHPATTSDRSA